MFVPSYKMTTLFALFAVLAGVLLLPAAGYAAPAAGTVSAPGDLVFVGYNADNADGFAFALLGDAAAGQEIHFRDDEWNGSGWNNANEGSITWTAPAGGVTTGTVVAINDTTGTPAASQGTAVGSLNLNTSNEVLYAYLGTVDVPTTFLTALASDGFTPATGELSGTGLIAGSTAIDFDGVDDDVDVAVYAGPRNNQSNPDAYRVQIHDLSSHWLTDDGSGDQSGDGTAPDLPFDLTPLRTPTAVSLHTFQVAAGHSIANLIAILVGVVITIGALTGKRRYRR